MIILPCLGSLTLIALSYGKQIANPVSVANISQESNQIRKLKNSIAQEEKLPKEISNVARKAIELGHYNYAQQQIEIIEDLPLKVELLRELAHAYLSVGQTQQATIIVNQSVELDKQSGSFDSTTWYTDWLLTGQEEKVKDIIANLDDSEEQQAQIRLNLAQSYLEVGKITRSFEIAKLIPSDIVFVPDDYPDPRNELLQKIVEQALPQNNFDLAEQVAISFPRQIEQVIALRKIAHQYFKEKKYVQVKAKLDQALTIAEVINAVPVIVDRHTFWSEPNTNFLLDLAQDYQKLGEKQQAAKILDLATESIKSFKTQFTFDVVVWNRSQALRQVASRYLDFGEIEKAITTLDLATQEAKKFRRKREVLIQELLKIATLYVKVGKQQQAKSLWEEAFYKLEIIDPKSAELVLETAKVAVLVGRSKEGIELVETTQSFLMQLEIAVLAGEEKLIEQLTEAKLNEINKLPYDHNKIVLLEQVALSLAENQKIAFKFLEKIQNPFEKAYILVAISQQYAQKNNWNIANSILDKAVDIAKIIPEQKQQEQWFIETTNQLIKINEIDNNVFEEEQLTLPLWQLRLAEKITEKSNSSKLRAEVLFKISEKQLIENDEKKALFFLTKLIKTLQDPTLKQESDQEILHLFKLALKYNKNNFALEVAQNIPNTDYKIVALRQLAQKYALNGNKEKAKIILHQVIKIVQTIENSTRKQELMKGIAQQQDKISRF